MKVRAYEDEEPLYLSIIEEMKSKLRRGPLPKSADESQSFYEIRCESFYEAARGMIAMCRHQLGESEVKLSARKFLSYV